MCHRAGVQAEPTFYDRPESTATPLVVAPRLASWNAAGHPDQVRLSAALDHAEAVLTTDLDRLDGPLALRLDIGMASEVDLLAEHDLDNYLFPLATRLGKRAALSLVSVWGTKQHAAEWVIRVAPAAVA